MYRRRPAQLLAAIGASASSAGLAATIGAHRLLADDPAFPTPAIALVAVTLIVVATMLIAGRIGWRRGALVLIGCGAMLGGGAIHDGMRTAIAVSS